MCSWAMNSVEVKRGLEMFTECINRIIVLYPFLRTEIAGFGFLKHLEKKWYSGFT